MFTFWADVNATVLRITTHLYTCGIQFYASSDICVENPATETAIGSLCGHICPESKPRLFKLGIWIKLATQRS